MFKDVNGIKFVVGDEVITSSLFTNTIIDIYNRKIICNSDNYGVSSYNENEIVLYNMRIIDPMKQRALDKNGDMVQVGDTVQCGGLSCEVFMVRKAEKCDTVLLDRKSYTKKWDWEYASNVTLVKPEQTKVKVEVGGETYYISNDSLSEFKRMLYKIK